MDEKESILIVDDDESICRTLALVFGKKGYHIETARTGCRAIEKAKGRFFNVALLDIKLPDMGGIELLGPLKAIHPDMETMMITGHACIETTVQALNHGAFAYLTKPLNMDQVLATVQNAIEKQRLVSEKRQAEEALRRSEQRFSQVAASTGDWTWEVDPEGRYLYSSGAVKDILGYTPQEILGKYFYELFHPEDRETIKAQAFETFHKREPIAKLVNRNLHKDGHTVILETSGFPLIDENGELLGYRGADRDITERVQAQKVLQKAHQELAAQIQELARANEEMQSFIYSISHDLRMPLVAVQGFANLLKEEYGDDLKGEAEHYLSAILQSTGKMSDLIEDLLQLSRVGRMDTEPEEVALESLLEAITTELEVKVPKRKLNFRIKEPLPETYCNRKRLYQVFSNLLGNAVKFTRDMPEAKIEVGVRKQGSKREFYVRDNGPGIDPQYHQEIFKVFRRLHGSAYEGSGMGLTFAKKIVESWGGNLRLESKPGKGATFYFTVPEAQKSSRAKSERVSSDSSG